MNRCGTAAVGFRADARRKPACKVTFRERDRRKWEEEKRKPRTGMFEASWGGQVGQTVAAAGTTTFFNKSLRLRCGNISFIAVAMRCSSWGLEPATSIL